MLDGGENNIADMFFKYEYTETKDLLKTFLTLISATLVFSLTFSEKVIKYDSAASSSKTLLICAWGCFVIALVGCGLSLCLIAGAAGKAIYGAIPFFDIDGANLAIASWALILLSGSVYVCGFIFLIASAIKQMRNFSG